MNQASSGEARGGLAPRQRTTRRLILTLICGAALLALWGISVGQRAQLKRRDLSQSLALFDWNDRSPRTMHIVCGLQGAVTIDTKSPAAQAAGGFLIQPGGAIVHSPEEALESLLSTPELAADPVVVTNGEPLMRRIRSWLWHYFPSFMSN